VPRGNGQMGTYSTREKHENATVESYRVALLLFAVETACIQSETAS